MTVEDDWFEWRTYATTTLDWPGLLAAMERSGRLTDLPELAATRGVPQDPHWHAEGEVFVHLGLAAAAAARSAEVSGLPADDREIAVLGALVHDFGKVTHTDVTGPRITSRGHAEAGVAPARSFLVRIGAPSTVVERILPIVREHMTHVSVIGDPTRAAVRRLVRRLAENDSGTSIDDWARVVDADCAGRLPVKESPAAKWQEIARSLA